MTAPLICKMLGLGDGPVDMTAPEATVQDYTLTKEGGDWVARGTLRMRGPGVQPACCDFRGVETGHPAIYWRNLFETADEETQRRIVEQHIFRLLKTRFSGVNLT